MKMVTETEKLQIKEIIIMLMQYNPLWRRKFLKKVITDNPKNFYEDQFKPSSLQEKLDFLEDVVIFDESSQIADFLYLYNTYKQTGDKNKTLDALRRYKNG